MTGRLPASGTREHSAADRAAFGMPDPSAVYSWTMRVCTIVARNYLAHARVLAESFREQHPNGTCTVLLLDDPGRTVDAASEPFEVLYVENLGVPELRVLFPRYSAVELSAAVRPWFLKRLLDQGADHVVYLDPDIQLFAPLDDIGELAEEHGIVLASRVAEPIPRDGERPTEQEILAAGAYDPGFIALGNGETSGCFLDWWMEGLVGARSAEEPQSLPLFDEPWRPEPRPDPLFADQRWIDSVPNIFSQTKVLRDPGCDVAYWNLHARTLRRDGEDITVDGQTLRFFHFSGFLPDYPHWLSQHATRVKLSENPILAGLCASYTGRLKEHGYDKASRVPYGYGQLPNGLPHDDVLRRLYNQAMDAGEDFGDIFEPEGAEKFLRWINSPAEDGGNHGITRFMYEGLYMERDDVRQRFKGLSGPAGKGFIRWVMNHGRDRHEIPDRLVPDDPYGFSKTSEPRTTAEVDGVNVVGYLTGEMGLGEVARQNIAALRAGGVPVATKKFDHFGNRNEHEFEEVISPRNYSVNLICLQPPELKQFHREVGKESFEGRRSIGVWGWELDVFPEKWLDALDLVDEVWVWTSYVAETLNRISTKPVVTIPPPVVVPDLGDTTVDIGVPEGFTFLFVFDFHSVMNRKNPQGLVEAFKRAFAPGEGPQLVIKSINGDARPRFLEQLKVAALGRDDIHVVDRYVSFREKTALMAGCDCYVSLHRSEGFGFTPAEAMALGRPVIATGYSGNVDFMSNANSYLVDYTLTEVGPGSPPYPPDGRWAEPDLDHAAALMRHVWKNPDEARARGDRARRDIERTLSPEAIGKAMRARLERVVGAPPVHEPAPAPPRDVKKEAPKRAESGGGKLQAAQQILKQGPAVEAPSRLGRAGRFARRLVLRGMRPFTFYQGQFDTALVGVLQETAQRVKAVGARVERVETSTANKLERWSARLEKRLDALDAKLAALAESRELDSVPVWETTYLGHPFAYPYDSLIGGIIDRGEEWDAVLPVIVSALLPGEEPRVCEVGSNIGASLLQILHVKPRARVVALEPSTRFLPFLERNLEAAGFGHVEVLPLLAGREPGSMELYNNASTASVVSADYDGHKPRGKHSAEMTTLDEVFRDRGQVDFIKIDTDGFDFEVLRGAEATLRRDGPALYFEVATHLLSDPVADLSWLQDIGYRRFVCVLPQGKPQGELLIHGITEDSEQVVAWSRETGLCDVLVCPEGSPYEARLKDIKFGYLD